MKFVCGLMAISHHPSSSSPTAVIVHHRRLSVFHKSTPHFTRYIPKFPLKNLSAIYPQLLHIHTSRFYHWPPLITDFLLMSLTGNSFCSV